MRSRGSGTGNIRAPGAETEGGCSGASGHSHHLDAVPPRGHFLEAVPLTVAEPRGASTDRPPLSEWLHLERSKGRAVGWPRTGDVPAQRKGHPACRTLSPAPEGPRGSHRRAAPQGSDRRSRSSSPRSQVPLALRRSVRDLGTCSLHGTHTRGWSSRVPPSVTRAPFPAAPERHAFPQPAGTAGRLRVWPTARRTGPYLSVVAAAVLLHAAGQGGEAGLAGLPAGPRRRPVRVGVAGRRVTGCGFQPAGTRERWCVGSRDGGRGA